ncbi:MAG: hypothetical protein Q9213_001423 [Squamulea squamosa]
MPSTTRSKAMPKKVSSRRPNHNIYLTFPQDIHLLINEYESLQTLQGLIEAANKRVASDDEAMAKLLKEQLGNLSAKTGTYSNMAETARERIRRSFCLARHLGFNISSIIHTFANGEYQGVKAEN